MTDMWKSNWTRTQRRFEQWWRGEGTVLWVTAPADPPYPEVAQPEAPATPEERWNDPEYRARASAFGISRTHFAGEAFPFFDAQQGPGSLATYIGSEPGYTDRTVWFYPCMKDLHSAPALKFEKDGVHFQRTLRIVEEGLEVAAGEYLVSIPDLVENLDILCSLRGSEETMMELIENPEDAKRRLQEINKVYFEVFDELYQRVKGPDGGNVFSAFRIWGPGKTAKVQCDAAAMISERMFREFVVPPLAEQCEWLDYSLFHLDGVDAMHHIDALLEIDALNGIQWTPGAGKPGIDDPCWYDLYHKILGAGKALQLLGVGPESIPRLLDDLGPKGLYILTHTPSQETADELAEQVDAKRAL